MLNLAASADVVLRVRPQDSLVWALPVWLLCQARGIPVRLDRESDERPGDAPGRRHLAPQARIGSGNVSQLLAIVEALHECHPGAGIWPSDRSGRARARDACSGIVEACGGASPFVLALGGTRVGVDPTLAHRLESALHDVGRASPCATAAVATLLALTGLGSLLGRSGRAGVEALLDTGAAGAWLEQPAVRRRLEHFTPWLESKTP